ncbi:uncharacterized protein LACBIDRAFT_303652 [Laccaria bicolor S238N-H82]|uniref:Predicted protein n=1 Tax=Laccaria bicolor (strain S238N-H82 / ATCC MYA-4686) TaxID=486041 RepID=B0E487_LACBS|nr:uncharacterized protein LACBIDRAFT_303652 [Laccaria bicolor S238N-H82]EDQ98348.1 predicted protein [Laccaria bicolor S238N-H82]|eukprot:XP_001891004.1 predicted protein [Laccaria bicolor S238N-H82]
MVRMYKPGKVAIVRKAVMPERRLYLSSSWMVDEGSNEHPFPHAIVAGIERYPKGVLKTLCL